MRIMYALTHDRKADLIRALIVETGSLYEGFIPFEMIEPGLEAIYAQLNEEPGFHRVGSYTLTNRGCLRGPDSEELVEVLESTYGFVPVSTRFRKTPVAEVLPFSGPLTEDTQLCFTDLIAKHDEIAKMLQFPTEVQWLEEQPSEEEDDNGDRRIYAWDGQGNYHEISSARTDATTDACVIRFNRGSDDLEINVNWRQEA